MLTATIVEQITHRAHVLDLSASSFRVEEQNSSYDKLSGHFPTDFVETFSVKKTDRYKIYSNNNWSSTHIKSNTCNNNRVK